jgi:hypothetical protein
VRKLPVSKLEVGQQDIFTAIENVVATIQQKIVITQKNY